MQSRDCFSEPIPRKGTETIIGKLERIIGQSVFQNLFPERGLKHLLHRNGISALSLHRVFQNLFPERGLKPVDRDLGDVVLLDLGFSEPIPRKGTETRGSFGGDFWLRQKSFSEPIPRKGTETENIQQL